MNFAELKQSSAAGAKLLVLFYGNACAPCARLKPRLVELTDRMGIPLHQLNVAADMPAARELGIRGVPSLVALKDGQAEVLFTGELSDAQMSELFIAKGLVRGAV
jgi:thioredoxin-like negative regulator of GroEL